LEQADGLTALHVPMFDLVSSHKQPDSSNNQGHTPRLDLLVSFLASVLKVSTNVRISRRLLILFPFTGDGVVSWALFPT
jgi:hypothetical protein